MEGGIRAWKGLTASGAPEAGIAYFPPESSPSELTALAWILEDGTWNDDGIAPIVAITS